MSNIDVDEERTQLMSSTTEYGSSDTSADGDEQEGDTFDPNRSFHLGVKKLAPSRVLASMRFSESFAEYGDDYEKVPTLLKENVAILLDPNLEGKKGKLYYSKNAFYKEEEDPHYLLTVNTDIYQRVLAEVADSMNIPCGVYFCCHGGEGAHTGVSHDDFVSIELAWILCGMLFFFMIVLSFFD